MNVCVRYFDFAWIDIPSYLCDSVDKMITEFMTNKFCKGISKIIQIKIAGKYFYLKKILVLYFFLSVVEFTFQYYHQRVSKRKY